MSEPVSNELLNALLRESEARANARSVASGCTIAAVARELVDVRTALVGFTMPSETTAAESIARIIGGREAALVEIGRLQAEIKRLDATRRRYEETLRALDDEISGAMVEATGDLLARLEDLSHTLGDAWCCGEYATGSGQHGDECAHAAEPAR